MNRLFLCCVLSCTITTCILKSTPEQFTEGVPGEILEQASEEILNTLENQEEQSLPKILEENIATSVIEYVASLCKQKDFSLDQIPENMLAEKQKKINFIMDELVKIMHNKNRTFVYQHELEATCTNTINFFLIHVSCFLLNEKQNTLLKKLDISVATKKSSKMVLSNNY